MDLPKRAYDVEMLTRPVDRTAGSDHGWCFGLPPGILPQQWPIDPRSGYPLMHGFTLLLPEDYRVRGPELVALSFFATAPDHLVEVDGVDELADIVETAEPEPPSDPDLVPFWEARRRQHPRLFRMRDMLDCSYAVILLTREEFDGPLCQPPLIANNRFLDRAKRPDWLDRGAAIGAWEKNYSPLLKEPPEDNEFYKILGGVPPADLTFSRALRWTARANDPNAGKAPREHGGKTDYQSHFYWVDDEPKLENYREHDWARDHKDNHIGGTMRPCSGNFPDTFSSFYVEFEEYLGGYNFGCGNGRLDFRDMTFAWACD